MTESGVSAPLREAEFSLCARDELPPPLLRFQVRVEAAKVAVRRPVRVAVEVHVRFLRRAAGLAVITRLARGDDIRPLVRTAAVAWEDVVQRQVTCLLAAVLAGEAVAQEDIAARQSALRPRSANEVDKADDRRDLKERRRTVEVTATVLDDLGFTAIDQYKSSPDVAHVQRLVILVEH